jgi:hypothetical protein
VHHENIGTQRSRKQMNYIRIFSLMSGPSEMSLRQRARGDFQARSIHTGASNIDTSFNIAESAETLGLALNLEAKI